MKKTISIKVHGDVQGVFYRQSAKEMAIRAGIKGSIRNEADGSVHIVASGTSEQLQQFTAWCRTGPPRAKVSRLDIREIPFEDFISFTIERW